MPSISSVDLAGEIAADEDDRVTLIDDFAVPYEGVVAVIVADDPTTFDARSHPKRQFTLMPADLTSSLLMRTSSAKSLSNSADVIGIGSAPRVLIFAFTSGS